MRNFQFQILSAAFVCVAFLGCSSSDSALVFNPSLTANSTTDQESGTQEKSSKNKSQKNEGQEVSENQKDTAKMTQPKYNKLNNLERYVLEQKGTERAFVGKYTDTDIAGTYICRRCNAPLYDAKSKFHSGCGWPAFDDEIKGAVDRLPDADGSRTEIVCHNCEGHLGHVFFGERFTQANTRHCVNSISMKLIPAGKSMPEVIKSPKTLREEKEKAEAEAAAKAKEAANGEKQEAEIK